MTKGRYQGNRRSRRRRKAKEFTDRIGDLIHFERLVQILGDVNRSYVVSAIVFFIVASLLYLMTNTDLLTPPRENTLTDGAAAQTDEPPVDAPSVAELEAQEPIDITDGTWSFSREAQSYVLYTMDFESDGTFDVPDDSGFVQDGTYIVDGDSVEIELRRQKTYEAEGPQNDKRTEDVEWYEWFHMTRVGNTMRGSWEGTDWEFSYERGFELGGFYTHDEVILARPE